MRKLSVLLTFVMLIFLVIPVSAAERAVDFADLLTYDEETALAEKLNLISETYECDVVVLT
ncbi:MAG: TPM domain-containing protein, partial [Clostridia bacterium]|nr:TPM domain-containing protein [Clostridia bacterium]